MKRTVVSLLCACAAIGTAGADIQAPPGSEYTAERKLGRAIANLIYSPLEIPEQITRRIDQNGDNAAFSWGVVDGVSKMFQRMGYGVYELVTFWAPTYKCTYQPPYQGRCGVSGLQEYNPSNGLSEFPPDLGFETYYSYSREQGF